MARLRIEDCTLQQWGGTRVVVVGPRRVVFGRADIYIEDCTPRLAVRYAIFKHQLAKAMKRPGLTAL